MFLMMHTISGALRLLSPSSTPSVKLESPEPEPEPRQGACPHCDQGYDRVPPLPGPDRRRSSGYSHHEIRESSPRNKAEMLGDTG